MLEFVMKHNFAREIKEFSIIECKKSIDRITRITNCLPNVYGRYFYVKNKKK